MTAPGLRQRKQKATRQAIVDAATALFLERGFTGTTIDDIAERAGIARRTLFTYFPSKDDLLFHHIEQNTQDAVSAVQAATSPTQAAQAAVLAYLSAFDAPNDAALADLRKQVIQEAGGLPGSLLARMQGVHATLTNAINERFPDTPVATISILVGACLGAAAGAAFATPDPGRHEAMTHAVGQIAALSPDAEEQQAP